MKRKKKSQGAKMYGKNKSSIHEIVKMEKEIHASFAVMPETAKVMAAVCKQLVKMEKALYLYNKIF